MPVKDKNGKTLSKESEHRQRWREHFIEILNRIPPNNRPTIPEGEALLNVNTNPPTKTEIEKAINKLKNGNAAGPDGIPSEALRCDTKTATEMLYKLFLQIWATGQIPSQWKKGTSPDKTTKVGRYWKLQKLEGHYVTICPKLSTHQNNTIKQLYNGFSCQVIHNSKLTEPIEVETGVHQGCLLSPMIF